jgi:hypothetical protein
LVLSKEEGHEREICTKSKSISGLRYANLESVLTGEKERERENCTKQQVFSGLRRANLESVQVRKKARKLKLDFSCIFFCFLTWENF